ncbi:MAG: class I SAM-dependent methyltransferase [Clostridiales bacterium]|nr:class I SAM-dependent methyltransferase [Clostridiales bacterium]
MKLSKRLEMIINMVPELGADGCVADVGTDHGFVPIRLVQLGKAGRALALDVREGPLSRAREHIKDCGLSRQIETRLSDGLAALAPGEANVVVVTGMGGELTLRILREGEAVRGMVDGWVFSPQSELSRFRHGLEELGLAIIREEMVFEDGKYYTVMLAKPGAMHYEEEFRYRFGDCLIRARSPQLLCFLERQKQQYREILTALDAQDSATARIRSVEIEKEWKEAEEAYAAMQGNHGKA